MYTIRDTKTPFAACNALTYCSHFLVVRLDFISIYNSRLVGRNGFRCAAAAAAGRRIHILYNAVCGDTSKACVLLNSSTRRWHRRIMIMMHDNGRPSADHCVYRYIEMRRYTPRIYQL